MPFSSAVIDVSLNKLCIFIVVETRSILEIVLMWHILRSVVQFTNKLKESCTQLKTEEVE